MRQNEMCSALGLGRLIQTGSEHHSPTSSRAAEYKSPVSSCNERIRERGGRDHIGQVRDISYTNIYMSIFVLSSSSVAVCGS